MAVLTSAMTFIAQEPSRQVLAHVTLPWRFANAAAAYVGYLGQFFWPVKLSVFYPHPEATLSIGKIIFACAALLAISAAVFLMRKRSPYLAMGWLWFAGTLVPMIGLVQVGQQAMADRYTYLSQIGLYVAVAWGIKQFVGIFPYRRALFGAVVLLMPVLAASAFRQASYWRDSETLWRHALAVDTNSRDYCSRYCLALALDERGARDEAIDYYRQALAIKPDYALAHSNLGLALARRGDVEQGFDQIRTAVDLNPADPFAQNNLGVALARRGRAGCGHPALRTGIGNRAGLRRCSGELWRGTDSPRSG